MISIQQKNNFRKLFEDDNSENPYDLIVKNIKQKCKYYKIITITELIMLNLMSNHLIRVKLDLWSEGVDSETFSKGQNKPKP